MLLQLLVEVQLDLGVLFGRHRHQLHRQYARRLLNVPGSIDSAKTTRFQLLLNGVLAVDGLADCVMQMVQKLGLELFIILNYL